MRPVLLLALLALAACAPEIPNSAAGVGFEDYESYETEALGQGEAGPQISNERPGGARASAPSLNNPGISDEQDFEAVSERQTIESDAARLERLRAEYQVIQPSALPERSGADGPNIVAYALETTHPVGQQVYRRSGRQPTREDLLIRCAAYVSNDAAQRAFLEAGGPQRDRQGLDPDGDGYACFWDPTPFRAARR
ncbi:MAG: hypothetical protein QNJ13_08325 [Paracoccaceae bacterium]|nr:hypothetical protein [Paracoccaceae bacterium]